jgi:hypothetical protein
VGADPPSPKTLENIIVFGEQAIESTADAEFRRIPKIVPMPSEAEIRREDNHQTALVESKISDLRTDYDEQVAILQQKADGHDREASIANAKAKLEKKIAALRKGEENRRAKVQKQVEKAQAQNAQPKMSPNKKVHDIPGVVPIGFDWLPVVVQQWGDRSVPFLCLYWNATKTWYDYPEPPKKTKKTPKAETATSGDQATSEEPTEQGDTPEDDHSDD